VFHRCHLRGEIVSSSGIILSICGNNFMKNGFDPLEKLMLFIALGFLGLCILTVIIVEISRYKR